MKKALRFLLALGLMASFSGAAYAFDPNPLHRPIILDTAGQQPGDPRFEYLYNHCRSEGIIDEGCSFEILRPIQWRYRYYNPQSQVGECKYMCASNQYCQGVYKNTPIGYLCGAQ